MAQIESLDAWADWSDLHAPNEKLQQAVLRLYNRFSDLWHEVYGERPEPLRAKGRERACQLFFSIEKNGNQVEAQFEVDQLDPDQPDWEASVTLEGERLFASEVLPPYLLSEMDAPESRTEVHELYRTLIRALTEDEQGGE